MRNTARENYVFVRVEEETASVEPNWVERLLERFVPSKERAHEAAYGSVRRWLLEVDIRNGAVRREIGVNAEGKTVTVGPLGDHRGLWVDSPSRLDWRAWPALDEHEFEDRWAVALR